MTNPTPYTIRDGIAKQAVAGVFVGGNIVAESATLTGANLALQTLREEGYTDLRGPSYEPDREPDVPDVGQLHQDAADDERFTRLSYGNAA